MQNSPTFYEASELLKRLTPEQVDELMYRADVSSSLYEDDHKKTVWIEYDTPDQQGYTAAELEYDEDGKFFAGPLGPRSDFPEWFIGIVKEHGQDYLNAAPEESATPAPPRPKADRSEADSWRGQKK